MRKFLVSLFMFIILLVFCYYTPLNIHLNLRNKIQSFAVLPESDVVKIPTRITKHPKKEYCLIGEESGIRHCIDFNAGEICNSGETFDTKELCQYPELRY